MNKLDLIEALKAEAELTKNEAAAVVNLFFDAMSEALARGDDILMDIDVQGAVQILERFPDAVTIFIMPPSLKALEKRLAGRGTDSPETIARRLHNAAGEMALKDLYRHIIVNDEVEKAAGELIAVVAAYRGDGSTEP